MDRKKLSDDREFIPVFDKDSALLNAIRRSSISFVIGRIIEKLLFVEFFLMLNSEFSNVSIDGGGEPISLPLERPSSTEGIMTFGLSSLLEHFNNSSTAKIFSNELESMCKFPQLAISEDGFLGNLHRSESVLKIDFDGFEREISVRLS